MAVTLEVSVHRELTEVRCVYKCEFPYLLYHNCIPFQSLCCLSWVPTLGENQKAIRKAFCFRSIQSALAAACSSCVSCHWRKTPRGATWHWHGAYCAVCGLGAILCAFTQEEQASNPSSRMGTENQEVQYCLLSSRSWAGFKSFFLILKRIAKNLLKFPLTSNFIFLDFLSPLFLILPLPPSVESRQCGITCVELTGCFLLHTVFLCNDL